MLNTLRCEFINFEENAEITFILPLMFYSYTVHIYMFIHILLRYCFSYQSKPKNVFNKKLMTIIEKDWNIHHSNFQVRKNCVFLESLYFIK